MLEKFEIFPKLISNPWESTKIEAGASRTSSTLGQLEDILDICKLLQDDTRRPSGPYDQTETQALSRCPLANPSRMSDVFWTLPQRYNTNLRKHKTSAKSRKKTLPWGGLQLVCMRVRYQIF